MGISDRERLDHFLQEALAEDIGPGDYTSLACIPSHYRSRASLLVKEPGVLAGLRVAKRLFELAEPDSSFTGYIDDGSAVSTGDIAFEVEANSQVLLRVERVCLNIMQRMSGIATQSNRYAFEVEDLPVKILDTRKTTPLLRFLEKEAVTLGGCHNYRDGLYDRFMIKDNHIEACGGVAQAIDAVNAYNEKHQLDLQITVEVRNLEELYQVMDTGRVHRIMLDNFEPILLKEAIDIIGDRFETEASGGINIHNVRDTAMTGVQYISVGALTHSAASLDLSLKIVATENPKD